jgi:hypothetical protein
MAEAGDVDGLVQLLTATHWSLLDGHEVAPLLLRALEVRCARDPAQLAEDVLARMLSFSAYLMLRSQQRVAHTIEGGDQAAAGRGTALLTREVLEDYLPALVGLQGHVAELAQALATTSRLTQLACQKRLENDRLEKKGKRKRSSSRRPRCPKPVPSGPTNGEPVNRLVGLLDDLAGLDQGA